MTKKPIKARIIYRDKPLKPTQISGMFSAITFGEVRRWFMVMVPIVISTWAFAGPYINAKAEELLKEKLTVIGIDPQNIQSLNKNLIELQRNVDNAQNIGAQNAATLQVLKAQNETILQILMQKTAGESVK